MRYKSLLIFACIFSLNTFADIAVIVHPSNGSLLSKDEVKKIFSGRLKRFADGKMARPYNLVEDVSIRSDFDQKGLDRSSIQMKAYWSKLVFTGKGTPPKEMASEKDIIDAVANDPAAIGYVGSDAVNEHVKVALTLN